MEPRGIGVHGIEGQTALAGRGPCEFPCMSAQCARSETPSFARGQSMAFFLITDGHQHTFLSHMENQQVPSVHLHPCTMHLSPCDVFFQSPVGTRIATNGVVTRASLRVSPRGHPRKRTSGVNVDRGPVRRPPAAIRLSFVTNAAQVQE